MPGPTLAQALREQHEAGLTQQAETIRAWTVGRERHEQAVIHIRLALAERGMGRISAETQSRVYAILGFAMPNNSVLEDDPPPLAQLDRETDFEAAYYEQLERQSCPECGDGICPVEEIRPQSPDK